MDFRQFLFKYRSYTPIPFLVLMIILAYPSVSSLIIGFALVLSGESFRLWGVAYAGSETRTTDSVGGSYLITKGPFSHLRNPLYLGNILIYFGFGIMANVMLFSLAGLIYFWVQYSLIVSLEEEKLFKKFPDEYTKYYKAVPRFFPSLEKYSGSTHPQPDIDWRSGLKSEKRTLQAIISVTLLLIILWYVRS